MGYYTRVLSKQGSFPSVDELVSILHSKNPRIRLSVEEGNEDSWESLLLSEVDGTEIALIERNPVADGTLGHDEIAEFVDEVKQCRPQSGADWLLEYLKTIKTIYAFQHLNGSESEAGFEALDTIRSAIWGRGDAIIQADGEGFTNEDGYGIIWQFSESVTGPWNMAVLKNGVWQKFEMDLGNPKHRIAFLNGEVPDGLPAI